MVGHDDFILLLQHILVHKLINDMNAHAKLQYLGSKHEN